MIEEIKKQVNTLLENDNSGHGMKHVERVLNLSLQFAEAERADKNIVGLIALLHDVDDHKLFGKSQAKELTNAREIMSKCNINEKIQEEVCNAISEIGYSKRLKGIVPTTLEGKIVSDADMCDALGAIGIARVFTFGNSISRPLFDKTKFPSDDSSFEFHLIPSGSTINFMFEVLLKYKDLMLTDIGRKVATDRHNFIIDYLHQFFIEENVPEWISYLDEHK